MGKYEDLDDATRAEVDAAIEILQSDAQAAHNRELLERLDRLEARIPTAPPVADPVPPIPDPSPVPPPPRTDPVTDPANPPTPPADPPVTRKRSAWWGDRLNEE